MRARRKTAGWGARVLRALGFAMILVGLGFIAFFFVGLPGGTAGNIPTKDDASPTEAPTDDALYLTIPTLGIEDLMVHDSYSEEKLDESAIHLPDTGFPWQPDSNTYIAGHRMGYYGSDSFLVFFRLNELERGDKVTLKDSLGIEYVYQVTEQLVVGPGDVSVMNSVAGKSIVSLQTCTLPDYSDRLIVRGELL